MKSEKEIKILSYWFSILFFLSSISTHSPQVSYHNQSNLLVPNFSKGGQEERDEKGKKDKSGNSRKVQEEREGESGVGACRLEVFVRSKERCSWDNQGNTK